MTEAYNRLLYWIQEREAIRARKEDEHKPQPWTNDPILGKYRFCNVRREDDRVTIWIRENIRRPFAKHPMLWFMLCLARQINWPPTLQKLIREGGLPEEDKWDWRRTIKIMEKMQKEGEQTFTGAYVIGCPYQRGITKAEGVMRYVMMPLWNAREDFTNTTMQRTSEWLSTFLGWGPFLSYQATVDMRFTHLLSRAPDRDIWAAAGPGTMRGLNRLWDLKLDKKVSQGVALEMMRGLRKKLDADCQVYMDFSDIPNICCEFDKYERVRLGQGKPRSLYKPETRY